MLQVDEGLLTLNTRTLLPSKVQRVCTLASGQQGPLQRIVVNVLHADEWKIGPSEDCAAFSGFCATLTIPRHHINKKFPG